MLLVISLARADLESIDNCYTVSKADLDADPPGADVNRNVALRQNDGNHGIFSPSHDQGVSIQTWDKNIIVVRSHGKDVNKMNFFNLSYQKDGSVWSEDSPYYYLKGDGKCLLRNMDYTQISSGILYKAKNW